MTCQFETPTFIYYSYSIAIALGLALAFLILWKDRKSEVNRSAFYFILALMLWTINDFFQWITRDVDLNLFSFRVSIFGDAIFLFFLYFAYTFSKTKIDIRGKLLWASPLLVNAIIFISNTNIDIHSLESCDFSDTASIYYSYILDLVYVFWATWILLKKDVRKDFWALGYQRKLIIIAIWFFLVSIIIYWQGWNATLSAETTCYFILSLLFSIFLIALAIIKWELFSFKTVLTMGFSIFIITAIFLTMFFFSISAFFTGFLIFMYLLLLLIFWKM